MGLWLVHWTHRSNGIQQPVHVRWNGRRRRTSFRAISSDTVQRYVVFLIVIRPQQFYSLVTFYFQNFQSGSKHGLKTKIRWGGLIFSQNWQLSIFLWLFSCRTFCTIASFCHFFFVSGERGSGCVVPNNEVLDVKRSFTIAMSIKGEELIDTVCATILSFGQDGVQVKQCGNSMYSVIHFDFIMAHSHWANYCCLHRQLSDGEEASPQIQNFRTRL